MFEGQSEPAMGENAWSVWDLFVALVKKVLQREMRDALFHARFGGR